MKLKRIAMAVGSVLNNQAFAFMARTGLVNGILPLVVDSLDGIAAQFRSEYAEFDDNGTKRFKLGVEGIEDTAGLKSALQKERDANKEAQRQMRETITKFKDIDPEKARQAEKELEALKEKMATEGKTAEELAKINLEKMQKDHEKKLKEKDDEVAKSHARLTKYEQKVLDTHILSAAAKAGVHQHAIDDALLRARAVFKLDPEGEAVQLDSDNNVVKGKDGKTPFTPTEWLEEMKEKAPHWFPAGSSGGGAGGGSGGAGSAKQITRAVFEAKSPADRKAFLNSGGKVV